MYLYSDLVFNTKESARDMAKVIVKEKCEGMSIGDALVDSGIELPKNSNIFVGMRTLYGERHCCRVEGVFSDLILNELPLLWNNSFTNVYENHDIDGSRYELSREIMVFTLRCLFKNEYKQYNNCNSMSNIIFRALNYPIGMHIFPNFIYKPSLTFKCILPLRGVCYDVSLSFYLNYSDLSIEYIANSIDYTDTIPELMNAEYKRILSKEDVIKWTKYIRRMGYRTDSYSVEDYPKFLIREEKNYLIFSGEKYFKDLLRKEGANIHFVKDEVATTTSIDCFESINGIDYVYTGAKSKYADVHIEKGEKFKGGRYYVYKDRMGFFAIGRHRVYYGSIEPIKNINGEIVLYGLKLTSSDELYSNRNGYYNCMTESLSVLQSIISDLDGKIYGEHNYIRDIIKNSKYYRYAGLVAIKDCKFSTLFKFENAVYAFIRYNGSMRLIFSKIKNVQEKKQLIQNMKKILSIPSFRKFCIKRVYSFNIFEAKSRISASLSLNKKYVGNYTDFDKLLELSNREKDIVFSVSCINKQSNEIESTFILENGNVTYIDGTKVDL